MPKQVRGPLGRKHKSRTQGSHSYKKHTTYPPRTVSNKRRRHTRIGKNRDSWGGVRVKNILVEEIGRWLHLGAL